jgi:hypothetical protein
MILLCDGQEEVHLKTEDFKVTQNGKLLNLPVTPTIFIQFTQQTKWLKWQCI